MKAKWTEYELDSAAIEEISARVQEYLNELGEEPRNIQRNRLMIEELLLRIRDAYDETVLLRVMIGRHFGRHVFRISYKGIAFDPTESSGEDNQCQMVPADTEIHGLLVSFHEFLYNVQPGIDINHADPNKYSNLINQAK